MVRQTAELVKSILEKHPFSRDDDYILYGYVMNEYGYSVGTGFSEVAKLIKEKSLPAMITVWRARRKVMELYPELRGKSYKNRDAQQMEYVEFSRDKSV